jgi:hypothetical protein
MGRAAARGGARKAAPEAVDQAVLAGAGRVSEARAVERDPGPLARFAEVAAAPDTMGIIVQRLTDADAPDTLKQIAKDWQVPYGRLCQWITEDRERAEQYSLALKFAADSFAHECVPLADGVSKPEDVPAAKLQIDTRLRVAGKWDRNRYGEQTKIEHGGSLSLISVLSSIPRGEVFENEVPAPALPRQVATEEVI